MEFCNQKLLSIITEAEIEESVIKDLGELGAKGYTIHSVRGKGEKGIRNSTWTPNSNVKIEVLCSDAICKKIVELLQEKYIKNYAMLLFVTYVEVLCAE